MISPRSIALAVTIAVFFASSSDAFSVLPSSSSHSAAISTPTSLNMFGDALKGAFGNDDSLGKAKDAGLSNGPQQNDNVTLNGKKVKAIVGQKVSVIAAQNRVKISYNCKAGDCGTCMVNMNGKKVKACIMSVPTGKCNINTI